MCFNFGDLLCKDGADEQDCGSPEYKCANVGGVFCGVEKSLVDLTDENTVSSLRQEFDSFPQTR